MRMLGTIYKSNSWGVTGLEDARIVFLTAEERGRSLAPCGNRTENHPRHPKRWLDFDLSFRGCRVYRYVREHRA